MIIVIDNGIGTENIAKAVRGTIEIATPKEASKMKASGYILSDGQEKNSKQNIGIIKKSAVPVLALGNAYAFMLSAFGIKPVKIQFPEQVKLNMERPCSLLLDMKKSFNVIDNCSFAAEEIPEEFDVFASSKEYPFEILGHAELPFFAVHFNPELGLDGTKILQNFVNFTEVWEKYHK